jgi:hypothetical protein
MFSAVQAARCGDAAHACAGRLRVGRWNAATPENLEIAKRIIGRVSRAQRRRPTSPQHGTTVARPAPRGAASRWVGVRQCCLRGTSEDVYKCWQLQPIAQISVSAQGADTESRPTPYTAALASSLQRVATACSQARPANTVVRRRRALAQRHRCWSVLAILSRVCIGVAPSEAYFRKCKTEARKKLCAA